MQKIGEEDRSKATPRHQQVCWELWFCTALTAVALGLAIWVLSDVTDQVRLPAYAMVRPP
jgi:hypothetical protein